jgi:hypothetical protein
VPEYGHHHRQLRKQYAHTVEAGRARCWRCGEPIAPGAKWHLGHDDAGERVMGPEHGRCNVGAMSRLRAADARAYRDGHAPAGDARQEHARWLRSLGWEGTERFSRHWGWFSDPKKDFSPACPCESCRAQFPPCPCSDCQRRAHNERNQ